jgi:hypothetical protein
MEYWLGAVVTVLALAFMGVVIGLFTGATAPWSDNAGVVVQFFVWPALVVYHFIWKRTCGENKSLLRIRARWTFSKPGDGET